jgi:hypothetical protein
MLGYQQLPPPPDHIPEGKRHDLYTVREWPNACTARSST